jgi:hypothetical protein
LKKSASKVSVNDQVILGLAEQNIELLKNFNVALQEHIDSSLEMTVLASKKVLSPISSKMLAKQIELTQDRIK